MKREGESLIVEVQNQSINLVKAKIDKSQGDSLSRVSRKVDESIDYIGSTFVVHWKLAKSVILKVEINGANMSQKVF